jgi:hypothetical protein
MRKPRAVGDWAFIVGIFVVLCAMIAGLGHIGNEAGFAASSLRRASLSRRPSSA